MPKYIILTDEPREVVVKNNTAYFVDDGSIVPENLLDSYKSVLLKPGYNAKLLSQLTNTPYHFWYTADDNIKNQALEILSKAIPELQELRDKQLKERFVKRAKRASSLKYSK